MPDPAPTPTPVPEPAKPKRTRGPINQRWLIELSETTELATTTARADYAALMAEEGIDVAFLTTLNTSIEEAERHIAAATGGTSGKQTLTGDEAVRKRALLKAIGVIQNRAKRKYTQAKDPGLDKYFINQGIESSRALLEAAGAAILETLKTDALPRLKPAEVTTLTEAVKAYREIQADQTGAQGDATSARSDLGAAVADIAAQRRQLQLAADLLWPADEPDNAGTRVEFKLPADKALA